MLIEVCALLPSALASRPSPPPPLTCCLCLCSLPQKPPSPQVAMAPGSPATLLSLPDDVLENICCLVLVPEVQPGRRVLVVATDGGKAAAHLPVVATDGGKAAHAQPCVAVPYVLLSTGCRCRPCRRYAPPPRHVAVACRRLRAAANSPAVLHTLSASVGSPHTFASDDVLPSLRSLCHFVVHVAAPHVQRLRLGLGPAEEMESADWLEAGMLLASLLQACSGLRFWRCQQCRASS